MTERGQSNLSKAAEVIKEEYGRRATEGAPGTTGAAMFKSRLRSYSDGLRVAQCLPLQKKRILDLGCANGKWLELCCSRWDAQPENCVGVDLREEMIREWRAKHPESEIRLHCQSAHEIEFADATFDLVHHSMMFSSVLDSDMRVAIASQMWRVLAPGGCVMSYDFWINPRNAKTVGIGLNDLRGLFPGGKVIFRKRVTLVPPLTRLLNKVSQKVAVLLERGRILNTHLIVMIRKAP